MVKTRRQNIIKSLIFIGLFAVLVTLLSCKNSPLALFEYTSEPFSAMLSGTFGDVVLEADIYCDFSVHQSKEIYPVVIARLSGPEAFRGAVLTAYSDGNFALRLGELSAPLDSFECLAEPYFLLLPEGEPFSVEKGECDGKSGYIVTFSDNERELSYFFSEETRLPSRIKGVYRGKGVDLYIEEKK